MNEKEWTGMKKAYQTPKAKMVNYKYDEQVTATSATYCDQGWTRMTTLSPKTKTTWCDRCDGDLIWLNQNKP